MSDHQDSPLYIQFLRVHSLSKFLLYTNYHEWGPRVIIIFPFLTPSPLSLSHRGPSLSPSATAPLLPPPPPPSTSSSGGGPRDAAARSGRGGRGPRGRCPSGPALRPAPRGHGGGAPRLPAPASGRDGASRPRRGRARAPPPSLPHSQPLLLPLPPLLTAPASARARAGQQRRRHGSPRAPPARAPAAAPLPLPSAELAHRWRHSSPSLAGD